MKTFFTTLRSAILLVAMTGMVCITSQSSANPGEAQGKKQQAIMLAKEQFEIEKQKILLRMSKWEISKREAKAQIEAAKMRIIDETKEELRKQEELRRVSKNRIKTALLEKLKPIFDKFDTYPKKKRNKQIDRLIESTQLKINDANTSEKDKAILYILLEILRDKKVK